MGDIKETTKDHIYKEVGKLEDATESFEEEVDECEEEEAMIYTALVWIGRAIGLLFGGKKAP